MALKVLCSGHLVRHPVGGHTWHHLQYLIGLQRLGHEVAFFEHFGWENSCFDVARNDMTGDPSYGLAYLRDVLARLGVQLKWSYLAENGRTHGSMERPELAQFCRECDLYLNLSNLNWIDDLNLCRRRILVDTDPVFTQIGALGMGGPYARYAKLFTYGENVHQDRCQMPTAGQRWLPTRQPVVLDLWKPTPPDPAASFTTVVNWSPIPDQVVDGRLYGQKDREFEPYFELPRQTGLPMQIAANAPPKVWRRLREGGWGLAEVSQVTRDPWTYRDFLARSRGEFCVAKHGYVAARCGWFSDRSTAYLAMGRPVVVQDTGFSDWLPCGSGVIAFRTPEEAHRGLADVCDDLERHSRDARRLVEHHFDARVVLKDLLDRAMD